MKLIHTSDIHIGKAIRNVPLYDDQRYILEQILDIAEAENADGIIIAGDVYDKALPSGEAGGIFGSFVAEASKKGLKQFVISGNHDQAERIDFGKELMSESGLYIKGVYDGKTEPVILKDEFGEVYFYMLPFVRLAGLRRFFPDAKDFKDAIRLCIEQMNIDKSRRNVLIMHGTVLNNGMAKFSESEDESIGGIEGLDASAFAEFDYVAMGHLHSPQYIMSENIRYSGSPLKYSLSEIDGNKSVTEVVLREKGNIEIKTIELKPRRDMKKIEGKLEDLLKMPETEDYIYASLKDEMIQTDIMAKLRTVFKNVLFAEQNFAISNSNSFAIPDEKDVSMPLHELFRQFYKEKSGIEPTAEEMRIAEEIAKEIEER